MVKSMMIIYYRHPAAIVVGALVVALMFGPTMMTILMTTKMTLKNRG
jgi:hypothetical protein